MSKKLPAILLLIVLLLLPLCLTIVARAESNDNPVGTQAITGQAAPKFTLTDTYGKTHNLADYKGKYVVLEWFNQQCPFVKKHYDSGNMQQLQKEYTKKGVIWLSICSSAEGRPGYFSPSEHNKMFAEKKAAPSAILLDATGAVGHLYGAKSTPDMFLINPKGIIIYAGAIDDKRSTEISDIATAKNYVKTALDESMSGKPVAISSTKSYGCSVKYQ